MGSNIACRACDNQDRCVELRSQAVRKSCSLKRQCRRQLALVILLNHGMREPLEASSTLVGQQRFKIGLTLMIERHTFISVVIPSYNRPAQLAACLQGLSRLDYPVDRFEVIVVDDGSKIPLEPTIAPLRGRLNLLLLTQPNLGCGPARNSGAGQARGAFLAFTDDDTVPAPDWLSVLTARLATAPDRIVGGRTINQLKDNPYATTSQLLIDYLYAYYNADSNRATFFAGNNLALPARLFREVGGFDPVLRISSEDREFCDRWLYYGHATTYAPEAIVYHAHHLTFRSFCKQHFRYGRGAFLYQHVRLSRGQERLRVEPGRFYSNLSRYPFRLKCGGRSFLISLLLMVSQAANFSGFLWEGARRMREKKGGKWWRR